MGLFRSLANADIAEICAGLGFDWLLVDAEHGPQTLPGIIEQLRAIASCPPCAAVVRVPSSDPVAIRQILDLGATTLMVPMVETAEQAFRLVEACRYPPSGSRGIGGARASRWGGIATHVADANERSEEHTSELQSLMRISYAVFCLKKKKTTLMSLSPEHE